jgi:sugar lactone lactonase YvrE
MSRKVVYVVAIVALVGVAAASIWATQTQAEGAVEVVKAFDNAKSELPEGIAMDKAGNLYVSLGPPIFVGGGYGAIYKIGKDGSEGFLVEYPDGPAPAGLAVDPSGTLFYALPAHEDEIRGVYRLAKGGEPARLQGTEKILLPNGIALDKRGNLYVSDSISGAIWRVSAMGDREAEVWIQHPLLAGCDDPNNGFGANCVAFWRDELYVANTAKGLLVSVPRMADASAGTPRLVAGIADCDPTFDDLDAMDGIALDVEGNVYALLVLQDRFVRIDPSNGSHTLLLDQTDGLHNGASITFGTGEGDGKSVFISNYAVLPIGDPPAGSLGPAVLKVGVGVPGLPIP